MPKATPQAPIFTPNNVFQAGALASKARFIACVGGKRAGKTMVGAAWLLKELDDLRARGVMGDAMIVVPTFKIWEQATSRSFKDMFGQTGWGSWKEKRSCFELKWRSKGGEPYCIYVRSADTPDSIEGVTAVAVWADEAALLDEAVWDNIQARVSIGQRRVMLTTTLYQPNWFWTKVVEAAGETNGMANLSGRPEIAMFRWSSKEQPAFSAAEYQRLKETMDPRKFARDYGGESSRLEGLVYPAAVGAICKPFAIPVEWKRFAGLDFGHSDPTACVCVAEKPAESATATTPAKAAEYFLFAEFFEPGVLLRQIAAFIQAESVDYILHDPRGAQEADELTRTYGCRRLLPADNNRAVGISRLQELFTAGRLHIFETCQNAIRELGAYAYKLSGDEPRETDDHACDALRYAFSREQMASAFRSVQTVPTSRRVDRFAAGRMSRGGRVRDVYTGYFY